MRKTIPKIALVILCQSFCPFALGIQEKVVRQDPAGELAKEVGKITEKENDLVELSQQTPPPGWKTIEGKFFTVSLSKQKCFQNCKATAKTRCGTYRKSMT